MKHRLTALAMIVAVASLISAVPSGAAVTPPVATTPDPIAGAISADSTADIGKTKKGRAVVTFKTTGLLTYDTKSLRCAPGVINPAYCSAPPTTAEACHGKVRVTYYRGPLNDDGSNIKREKKISRRSVFIQPDCTYSLTTVIGRNHAFNRVFVRVAYLGTSVILPDHAPAQSFDLPPKP